MPFFSENPERLDVFLEIFISPFNHVFVADMRMTVGAFFGGVTGARVAKEKIVWVTSAIGLVLSLWAFYTFYVVFPAVLWVPIGMLISVFLFSYLGGFVVMRSQDKKSAPPKNLTSS